MADYHDFGRSIIVAHDYGFDYSTGLWLPKKVDASGVQTINVSNEVCTKDNGPCWDSFYGVAGQGVAGDFFGGTVAITDAPGAGNHLVVDDIIFSTDVKARLDFTEETTGLLIARFYLPIDGSGQITPRSKIRLSTANTRLMCQAFATGNHFALVIYHFEA